MVVRKRKREQRGETEYLRYVKALIVWEGSSLDTALSWILSTLDLSLPGSLDGDSRARWDAESGIEHNR